MVTISTYLFLISIKIIGFIVSFSRKFFFVDSILTVSLGNHNILLSASISHVFSWPVLLRFGYLRCKTYFIDGMACVRQHHILCFHTLVSELLSYCYEKKNILMKATKVIKVLFGF